MKKFIFLMADMRGKVLWSGNETIEHLTTRRFPPSDKEHESVKKWCNRAYRGDFMGTEYNMIVCVEDDLINGAWQSSKTVQGLVHFVNNDFVTEGVCGAVPNGHDEFIDLPTEPTIPIKDGFKVCDVCAEYGQRVRETLHYALGQTNPSAVCGFVFGSDKTGLFTHRRSDFDENIVSEKYLACGKCAKWLKENG